MKNSEHLFFLIKSLSKAEKRNFTLSAGIYSKAEKNNYVLLFEEIDKMETYNHQALVEKLSNTVSKNNIPALKLQLGNLILKSLRNIEVIGNKENELSRRVDYIRILYEKGLYDQAKKKLKNSKKLAIELNNFVQIMRIDKIEYQIALKENNPELLREYIYEQHPQNQKLLENKQLFDEFQFLIAKINLHRIENSKDNHKEDHILKEIIEHPSLKGDVEKYSVRCQIDYHTVKGYYYFATEDGQKAFYHHKKAVVISQNLPSSMRFWSNNVTYLMGTAIKFQMKDRYDETFDYVMKVVEKIPSSKKYASFDKDFYEKILLIKMDKDLEEGNFKSIKLYMNECHAYFDNKSVRLSPNNRMIFSFNFAYAYFGLKDYKTALFWVNYILNDPDFKKIRRDMNIYIRIINICVHYQLENYSLINSLVNSASHYIKSRNTFNILLDSFLSFAKKEMIRKIDENNKPIFIQNVNEWTQKSENPEVKKTLYYFNFIRWLEEIL